MDARSRETDWLAHVERLDKCIACAKQNIEEVLKLLEQLNTSLKILNRKRAIALGQTDVDRLHLITGVPKGGEGVWTNLSDDGE